MYKLYIPISSTHKQFWTYFFTIDIHREGSTGMIMFFLTNVTVYKSNNVVLGKICHYSFIIFYYKN